MTDTIQHIDVDNGDWDHAPAALRDHVKKLQARLADTDRELVSLRTERTERLLGDVLSTAGFKNPARVQRDILADKIDPTDKAAVDKWLAENGDDYARGAEAPAADNADASGPDVSVEAAAQAQMNSLRSVAQPTGGMSNLEAAMAEITPDMDGQAVLAVYKKYGV